MMLVNTKDAVDVRAADAMLATVELLRQQSVRELDGNHKATLGQFFTPLPIAVQLAAMFRPPQGAVRILDPGAGVGSLFAALVARFCEEDMRPASILVVAYEIDPALRQYLDQTFRFCESLCSRVGVPFAWELHQRDFLEDATQQLQRDFFVEIPLTTFTHAITNPPYRKVATLSPERRALQRIGVEATNLYSGFVAAAIQLLEDGGELVAITPRSFCNGPYFKQFRKYLLSRMALDQLHLYESRQALFRDDSVLQENISYHAIKAAPRPSLVTVTTTLGQAMTGISREVVPYQQIVQRSDPEMFIRIGADSSTDLLRAMPGTLRDLGLSVSTGRVVDFRVREYLRHTPEENTVPLIYPLHLTSGSVVWPMPGARKANAIVIDDHTRALVVPRGHYVLVRRLSAKEEKHRVVAVVYDGTQIDAAYVAFENHLNYFHERGTGVTPELAVGLAAYLNSSLVDKYVREFNGHTQVNATDLRSLPYPSRATLCRIGSQVNERNASNYSVEEIVEQELR